MQYRILGNTGVRVSPLCMGTMTFGREADESTCDAIYRRCREAGINFFDTANMYANGESKRILGDLIAGERDEVVITRAMHHPHVTAPIIGARNLDQLVPALPALDFPMTPAWRDEITALSVDPPLPTDRLEEQVAAKTRNAQRPPRVTESNR